LEAQVQKGNDNFKMEIENYVIKSEERELLTKFKDEIGQKANGLFECETNFVPKFLVISSALFKKWFNKDDVNPILKSIQKLAIDYFSDNKLIIRSSAERESYNERGFYESSLGEIQQDNICNEIIRIWKTNILFVKSFPDNNFSIVIQQYIKPKYLGHLSNERRLNKYNNSWYYEILNPDGSYLEGDYINTNNLTKVFIEPFCNTKVALINVLKNIATNNSYDRFHFEWVWDGNRIWIVQKDKEYTTNIGNEPGNDWRGKLTKIIYTNDYTLRCLNTINSTKNSWEKIECIETFKNCGLPFGQVYILEGEKLLHNLIDESFPNTLNEDLIWLLTNPIVIRMDIKGSKGNRTLLPRTETLQNIEEVKNFIINNLRKFRQEGINFDNICFLLHRFIISKSCAFALSKPNMPRARIDSTWGIIDGLYFHPHDSFEVQKGKKFSCQQRIRCKTEYLDTDSNGKWVSKKSGEKFDWKESLTKNELKRILEYNEKIAGYLNKEVTVMYFVGVFKETGYPAIIPWFYSTEEIPESSEKFTDAIFSEKRILITQHDEFKILKERFDTIIANNRVSIKLKLVPELLRDREFIEEIGKFSAEKRVPIVLDGSILSHPYYILRKQNAIVQVRNPFEPTYSKQTFYKLVRDKIPVQIESKGEIAKVVTITPEQTLELIKQKIVEEAYEFFWEEEGDNLMEELADLYELIRGAAKIFSADIDEIKSIADKKREKKGGFEAVTFLIETQEKALIEIIDSIQNSKLEIDNDNSKNQILSQIPRHHGSSYSNETINISYIPSLFDKKTKKRTEIVGPTPKDSKYIIEYTKNKIIVKPPSKIKLSDLNQLEIRFDDL
jgi:predicted house-cleaning noncanonical NTP pyrophosphatase (MazG superfamily)